MSAATGSSGFGGTGGLVSVSFITRTQKPSSFRRRATGSPSVPVAPMTKIVFCVPSVLLFRYLEEQRRQG